MTDDEHRQQATDPIFASLDAFNRPEYMLKRPTRRRIGRSRGWRRWAPAFTVAAFSLRFSGLLAHHPGDNAEIDEPSPRSNPRRLESTPLRNHQLPKRLLVRYRA